MSKTIWYVSKYASPAKYGFASRHFYFCKEFQKKGINTVIITSDSNHTASVPLFDDNYQHETIDGIKTIWCKCIRYNGTFSIKRILSWLQFEFRLLKLKDKILPRPDAIIVSSLSLFTILNGIRLKRKYKCKLVFEIRDIWPLTLTSFGHFSNSNPVINFLGWVEKAGYRKSDLIIGTMPNLEEHVQKQIGEVDKCFSIPQGVDLELFSNPEPLSREYISKYIPKNKIIVCYAGSIGITNALDTLLEVATSMQNIEIHFLFVGNGDLKEKYIKEYNSYSNITFAPRIKKEQVQSLLKECDILYDSVNKSKLYDYGLSRNKWIDYMYSEKPIIASFSGFKSMVNEANCGVFVEAENQEMLHQAINEMADLNKEERDKIGKKGRAWLLKYRTFDILADRYLKIIDL